MKKALGVSGSRADDVRVLSQGEWVAQATVDVDGRKTLVQLPVDLRTGKVDRRAVSLDVDGDGRVDPFSPLENVIAREESDPMVFRLGTTYVAVTSIDEETGSFVLEERRPSDYLFFELDLGKTVPDFTFVDRAGKQRRLSEYRGRYVLLDFWATSCMPCVREIPTLKAAYEKYRTRGFEIVGLNEDESLEALDAFLQKHDIRWTQAPIAMSGSGAELDRLIHQRFRIYGIPAGILVDPAGKLVSMTGQKGAPALRGQGLLDTLERLMPADAH